VVVIPARDEEGTVDDAVRAVLASAASLPGGIGVDVVVVADGCRDATAATARAAGAVVLEIDGANVGTARRIGCRWALGGDVAPQRLWIATTDADSVVPQAWLQAHLRAASRHDVFLGTIELPAPDRSRHCAWRAEYAARVGERTHGHVHGANLGVRGSAYLAAGGFHDLAAHEDVDLVDRLVATGATPARDQSVPVTTSARHESRVAQGVGPDLATSVAVGPAQSARDSRSSRA
jgi:glycosyltransferase involved in cell wall biosynthesis